jgi:sigma-B regulation protein RsbU (phosphoserine phosphatase)
VYVERLWHEFAEDLKLHALAFYREQREAFAIERRFGAEDEEIDLDHELAAPVIAAAFEQRVLLFDANAANAVFVGRRANACPCAVVSIAESRQRYLLLFTFESEWHREYAEFALNTARSALIARLSEQRLGGTLREAAAIQESLLPAQAPVFRDYEIAGRSIAAEEVGGDFFDYLPVDEDTLGLSIGDASGHGLPAALVARDVVVALRMGVERELKLRHTMRKLNRVIHSSNLTSGFVSLFYAELESNGNLFFINAGHEPPLLATVDKHIWLPRGGPVLGPLPDAEFKSHFIHVDRGAVLVLYTDGIIERRNSEGEFYGRERLSEVVADGGHGSAHELVELLFASADEFGGRSRWEDDATIVVVRRSAGGRTEKRGAAER